jgi:hypothetical protein
MAPTLLGKKTENCRTSGPPILEVVSGKLICMLFESRAKIGEQEYLTDLLPFPTEFARRKRRQPAPTVAAIYDHLFLCAVLIRLRRSYGETNRAPLPRCAVGTT